MNHAIVVDFETANGSPSSVCSVGIVIVRDGEVVDSLLICFTGTLNANKLLFHAYSVWHRKEWYRMLTYGAVHGGWGHLFFNMI